MDRKPFPGSSSSSSDGRPCAVCGQHKSIQAFRPFCSKRCADVDLNRWLSGEYRIETDETSDYGAVDEEG